MSSKLPIITNKFKCLITNRPIWNAFCPRDSHYQRPKRSRPNKPVVLVSSNETDVPFDLQHIRVIYYDVSDPFWGNKLIEKVAENILSALKNPEEAIFKSAIEAEG